MEEESGLEVAFACGWKFWGKSWQARVGANEAQANLTSHESLSKHTSRTTDILGMISPIRRLALIAVVACLLYTALAQDKSVQPDPVSVGSLSTQEIEEQLQVSPFSPPQERRRATG